MNQFDKDYIEMVENSGSERCEFEATHGRRKFQLPEVKSESPTDEYFDGDKFVAVLNTLMDRYERLCDQLNILCMTGGIIIEDLVKQGLIEVEHADFAPYFDIEKESSDGYEDRDRQDSIESYSDEN